MVFSQVPSWCLLVGQVLPSYCVPGSIHLLSVCVFAFLKHLVGGVTITSWTVTVSRMVDRDLGEEFDMCWNLCF